MPTTILLVDDNILFRSGMGSLLSSQADFVVVGSAANGREAQEKLVELQADIVLMDIRLAGLPGLGIIVQIKRSRPQTRIVLLTTLRAEDYVRAALGFGADGYILKDASVEELLMCLRTVAKGSMYLSPDVSGRLVESFLHPETGRSQKSGLDVLTCRERAILQLIAEGRTNRGTAEFLCESPKTVEKHRSSLMQKLGLRNAAELTVVALEMGLVERPISVCRLMGDPNAVCTVDDTNVQASPAGRSESRKLVLSSQS